MEESTYIDIDSNLWHWFWKYYFDKGNPNVTAIVSQIQNTSNDQKWTEAFRKSSDHWTKMKLAKPTQSPTLALIVT